MTTPTPQTTPSETQSPQTQTIVITREIPHPPEKLWRALTQSHLIAEWLMQNDFALTPGHRFKFTADWGAVDCQILTIDPPKTLAYSWAAYGLESIVTFTLTPIPSGTTLRMEQSGFRPDQQQAFQGAQHGWQKFLTTLERITAALD